MLRLYHKLYLLLINYNSLVTCCEIYPVIDPYHVIDLFVSFDLNHVNSLNFQMHQMIFLQCHVNNLEDLIS